MAVSALIVGGGDQGTVGAMTSRDEYHDDSFLAIVDAVKALPDEATVVWSDDAFVFHPDAHRCSFVDAYAPLICDPNNLYWAWTIISSTTDEDDPVWTPGSDVRSTTVQLTPDASLWSVQHPDFTLEEIAAHTILCVAGSEPTDEQRLRLEEVAARTGGNVLQESAWTFDRLSEALEQWAACHAGRVDLKFVVDLELTSPVIDELEAIMEADKASDQPEGYEIAPGVRAGSHAFDQLLSMDPDEAAFLTTLMTQISKHHFGPQAEPHEDTTEPE